MSTAHHLAQHPDKFDITLVDSSNYCGGQAYSVPIDQGKHQAKWLNQGVRKSTLPRIRFLLNKVDS